MRRFLLIIFACVFTFQVRASTPTGSSGGGPFGLGLMVGSIISVTGKYWLSERGALDFGLGFVGQPWTVLYADYIWHIPGLFGKGTQFGRETKAYFGGGGGVGFWRQNGDCGRWNCSWDSNRTGSGTGVFIRGLFGFEWSPNHTPFGVFGELGPSILLTPGTGGTLDVGVGGRYYF